MYKVMIAFDIVEKQLQEKYGEDFKFKPKISYQHEWGKHKIDVHFCKDMAFWICKYKGKFYMNIVDEVKYKDRFTAVDLYTTLTTNAVETLKHLKDWDNDKM